MLYQDHTQRITNDSKVSSDLAEEASFFAKQFKARFSDPGKRWSRNGAENLLPIRSAVFSNRFDGRWTTKDLHLP